MMHGGCCRHLQSMLVSLCSRYWRFKASKRWGKKGARAGPNPFASAAPPPQDQWKSQLHGLKRKAAAKRAQQQGTRRSTAPQDSAGAQTGARHPSPEADGFTNAGQQTSSESSAATQPQQQQQRPRQARSFSRGSKGAGSSLEADMPRPEQPLHHHAQQAEAFGPSGVPYPELQGHRGAGDQGDQGDAAVFRAGAGSARKGSWVHQQQQHEGVEQACLQQNAATAAAGSDGAWTAAAAAAASAAASSPIEEPVHCHTRLSHTLPTEEHSEHQQHHHHQQQQQRPHHYQGQQQHQQLGQVLPFLGRVAGQVHRLREQSSGLLQNHALRLAEQASQLGEHLQVSPPTQMRMSHVEYCLK